MTYWTEQRIGSWLARDLFQRRYLVVPNCNWTGHECDLLVVAPNLKICDVEIKLTATDFRADFSKQKWWHHWQYVEGQRVNGAARAWPPQVWKHYYVLPADVWRDDMLPPTSRSGVLLVSEPDEDHRPPSLRVAKRVRANPDAKPIDHFEAIAIARLANLRMWDALTAARRTP